MDIKSLPQGILPFCSSWQEHCHLSQGISYLSWQRQLRISHCIRCKLVLFKDDNEHLDTCRCRWHDAILILSPPGLLCLMVFCPGLDGVRKFISSLCTLVFCCLFGHFFPPLSCHFLQFFLHCFLYFPLFYFFLLKSVQSGRAREERGGTCSGSVRLCLPSCLCFYAPCRSAGAPTLSGIRFSPDNKLNRTGNTAASPPPPAGARQPTMTTD